MSYIMLRSFACSFACCISDPPDRVPRLAWAKYEVQHTVTSAFGVRELQIAVRHEAIRKGECAAYQGAIRGTHSRIGIKYNAFNV